jgi:hypothetical protein
MNCTRRRTRRIASAATFTRNEAVC